MKNYLFRSALIFCVLSIVCLISLSGCMPKNVETSQKGTTGMPTSVYDRGTPPIPWNADDLVKLPIHPDAKQYNNKRSFVTETEMDDVIAYYENELKDAEVSRTEVEPLVVTFKTDLFNLEILLDEEDDDLTLMLFSAPDGLEG